MGFYYTFTPAACSYALLYIFVHHFIDFSQGTSHLKETLTQSPTRCMEYLDHKSHKTTVHWTTPTRPVEI